MTRAIWKYTLKLGDQSVSMPRGAEVVHVAAQGGEVCMWAVVDPLANVYARGVRVVMTGEMFGAFTYLGTAHLDVGIVAHVLEEGGLF